MTRKVLVDLGERDYRVRIELEEKAQNIRVLDKPTAQQLKELETIERALDRDVVIDPFYREVLSTYLQKDEDQIKKYLHEYGLMGTQKSAVGNDLSPREIEVASICGLMQLDGITDPKRAHFQKKVSEAQGEYRTNPEVFLKVFKWLAERHKVTVESQIKQNLIYEGIVGCVRPGGAISSRRDPETGEMRETYGDDKKTNKSVLVRADEINVISTKLAASVVRKLVADRVSANDAFLDTKIEATFENTAGYQDGGPLSSMEIMLPDLEDAVDIEIIKDNLYAVQSMYFFMMLEEARLPQVVEYISEAWRRGAITLGKGPAGDALYEHHRQANERLSEIERRNFFMGTFGTPGGDPEYGKENSMFHELMLRTTSSVSQYFREFSTHNVFLSQEGIRKACRELAANLSVHGYGMAHYTAIELQQTILEYRDLLSDPEILRAFGARDMWQVVDQVNANYLNGLRNTYRYRIQAHSGAIIIRWLANNHQKLVGRTGLDVISTEILSNPNLRSLHTHRPLVNPTDWDFINACEQWLAVGGVHDDRVDLYSQPIESPAISTRPTSMPRVARDVLDSVGIELPGM
ncbi:hypothetical protein [Aliikangiella sp. G2MR2-5]|uniref:hypothetical protein n=1 Tax=Aliikangiella sp. G2MR2-5 TaxID=2788943 RepID=UPI0018AABD09|nr:hypothetical protein [Aliikangiella sp. G2MR2-5]